MARGMPSSPAQIDATAAALEAARSKSERTSFARSTKRRTASYFATISVVDIAPASGTVSDGTRYVSSPVIPRRSRLVARTTTSAPRLRISSSSRTQPSSTCSALSTTSSTCLDARYSITTSATDLPACCWRANACAIARGTSCGSDRPASSTRKTPSRNASRDRRAASIASRVLPAPPAPVNVTIRWVVSSASSLAISFSRPTKLVS